MTHFITTHKNNIRGLLAGLLSATFWLAVWQIISMIVAQELLVPAPLVVLKALTRLAGTAEFWQSAGLSLIRIVSGFIGGIIFGSISAVLTTRFRLADMLISPMLRIIRATPVASFIILALVWIKTGRLPAFISFLMVVPRGMEQCRKGYTPDRYKAFGNGQGVQARTLKDSCQHTHPVCDAVFHGGLHYRHGAGVEIGDCRRSNIPSRPFDRKTASKRKDLSGNARGLRLDYHSGFAQYHARKNTGCHRVAFRTAF